MLWLSIWEQAPGQAAQALISSAGNVPGYAHIRWSAQGKIIYPAFVSNGRSAVFAMDPAHPGQIQQLTDPAYVEEAEMNARGQIAEIVLNTNGELEIEAAGTNGSADKKLGLGSPLSFGPNGKHILYVSQTGVSQQLMEVPFRGGPAHRLSRTFVGDFFTPSYSPHGRRILMETHSPETGAMVAAVFPVAHPRQLQYMPVHRNMHWALDGTGFTYVKSRQCADNIWLHPGHGPDRMLTHFHHGIIMSYAIAGKGKIAIAREALQGSVVLFQTHAPRAGQ